MPELPEVETIVSRLKKKVCKRTFLDIWTDFPKNVRLCRILDGQIQKSKNLQGFKRRIIGGKIENIWRAGKNVIFDLSFGTSLLIHQKLTGHLLYGRWKRNINGEWEAQAKGPLKDDPMNKFLHFVFFLDNGWQISLSDLRKFAKLEVWPTKDLLNSKDIRDLGPDALAENLTLREFQARLERKKGKIKQVLMEQSIVAGIGNIYSDEILFAAKVNPLKPAEQLSKGEYERVYRHMRRILKKAISLQGTSISDYRTPSGEKGGFAPLRKVYRRKGEECLVCKTKIERIKIGSRSAHFCPNCQR